MQKHYDFIKFWPERGMSSKIKKLEKFSGANVAFKVIQIILSFLYEILSF